MANVAVRGVIERRFLGVWGRLGLVNLVEVERRRG
jgi:hypothetical protein